MPSAGRDSLADLAHAIRPSTLPTSSVLSSLSCPIIILPRSRDGHSLVVRRVALGQYRILFAGFTECSNILLWFKYVPIRTACSKPSTSLSLVLQTIIVQDPRTPKRYLPRWYGVNAHQSHARNVDDGRSRYVIHPLRQPQTVTSKQCTGGTPRCERCEKKGVKCEYIPCSQQKASTNASPTASSELDILYSQSIMGSTPLPSQYAPQWQTPAHGYPTPMTASPMPYQQHSDWQPNTTTAMPQQHSYYGTAGYSHTQYPSNNSSAMSTSTREGATYPQTRVVPSQAYLGSGYPQIIGGQAAGYPYNGMEHDAPHALLTHSYALYFATHYVLVHTFS